MILFCLAQPPSVGPFPPATVLVSILPRALLSNLFSVCTVSLSHLATQFHGFNPTWKLIGPKYPSSAWGISSQSPKSIFPTAYWISPPECTARNSDSTFTKSNSLTTSGLQLNSYASCCDGYDLTPVAQARNLGIILDLSIFFTPTSRHTLNAFNCTC